MVISIIVFEHIMEPISHKSTHINTIIHSKRTSSQAHKRENTICFFINSYYLLYTKRFIITRQLISKPLF